MGSQADSLFCQNNSRIPSQSPSQFTSPSYDTSRLPQQNVAQTCTKASWDSDLTEKFIRLCVVETLNGNRPGAYFNKKGWANLISKFQQATGLNYEKTQLKNKWEALKKDWGTWTKLIRNETGLGWDVNRGTVVASAEWWEKKLEVTPLAAKFRKRGPIMLNDQEMLFADVVANGARTWAHSCGILPEHMQEEALNQDSVAEDSEFDTPHNVDDDSVDEAAQMDTQTPENPTPASRRKRAAPFPAAPFSVCIPNKKFKKLSGAQLMVKCLDRFAGKIDEMNANGSTCSHKDNTTIKECLAILENMNEVEEGGKLWLYATRLFLKPGCREVFVNIKDHVRQVWLEEQMERDMCKRGATSSVSNAAASRGMSGENDFVSS